MTKHWTAVACGSPTGARRQPTPCAMDSLGYGASETQLALDGRGGLLVAWVDMDCGTDTLSVQRRAAR